MSIDRSLRVKSALKRHRNVLSREERIKILKTEERWADGDNVTGLPKVAHRKQQIDCFGLFKRAVLDLLWQIQAAVSMRRRVFQTNKG